MPGVSHSRFTLAVREIAARPTIAAVVFEGFLTRLGFGMIGFALPLYALSVGMDIAEVGLLYALRTVITLIAKPLMGMAADKFGRKPILVGAVTLRCMVGLLFMFAVSPWQLFAIRGLQGAMTAAREPSAMALLAEHGNKQKMASAFALYTTGRELGKSLGYGAAGLLIALLGFQWLFLVAFLCSCVALATVIFYVSEKRPESAKLAEADDVPAEVSPSLQVRLMHYASFGFGVALSAEMMRGLFPVIATEYAKLSTAQAGIAASAASVAILVAGPFFGWLSDRGNRKMVLSLRSMANALSSVLFALVPNFAGFLAGRLLDDTGKAAFRPAWGSVLADVSATDKKMRARTMAMLDTAADAGEILGPVLAGAIIGMWGIPAMLGVRAGFSLISEIQAFFLFRARRAAKS